MLQVPGAMDMTVEFTSMSKTFSMPGWRMGFAVGNERIIAALARVKSYLDYGAFTPVQVAATAALNGPGRLHPGDARDLQPPPRRAGRKFRPRRLAVPPPTRLDVCLGADAGTVPERWAASNSRSFWLKRPSVAVSPGIGFGEHGEGFVRIALVENEQRIRQAARNIRRFLETGAGKIAQRRSARQAALIALRAFCSVYGYPTWLRSLKVGVAGLGTVGAVGRAADRARARVATARCGRPIEVVAVTARSKAKKRDIDLHKIRWVADPNGLRSIPRSMCSSS